jgi:hypothetical protein
MMGVIGYKEDTQWFAHASGMSTRKSKWSVISMLVIAFIDYFVEFIKMPLARHLGETRPARPAHRLCNREQLHVGSFHDLR